MAVVPQGPLGPGLGERAGRLARFGGAALSVALVIGVGVWGWQLMVRDVTGIPVVRAMEGPMRTSPAEPGGEVTPHAGLSVNAIAALGEAAPPEDVLLLAPANAGLAPEDFDVAPEAEADEFLADDVQPETAIPPGLTPVVGTEPATVFAAGLTVTPQPAPADGPLSAEQVLAMAAEIAEGAPPLTALAPGTDVPVSLSIAGEAAIDTPTLDATATPALAATDAPALAADGAPLVIAASVPGVAVAPRPPARPGTLAIVAVPAAPVSDLIVAAQAITATLPSGTHLVQFGAYPTPEAAGAAWTGMLARFPEFLAERQPVIQAALSGGSTFFRLRTMGFADLAEARRFCVAFVAEDQECIYVPVP